MVSPILCSIWNRYVNWKQQEDFVAVAVSPPAFEDEQPLLSVEHEPVGNSGLLKREEKVDPDHHSTFDEKDSSDVIEHATDTEEVIVLPTVSSVEGSSTTFSGEEVPLSSSEGTPISSLDTGTQDPPLVPPAAADMDNKEDEEEFMPAEPSMEIEKKEDPSIDVEKEMTHDETEDLDVVLKTDEFDISVNKTKDSSEMMVEEIMDEIGTLQDEPTLSLENNAQISMEKPEYDEDEAASSSSVLPAVLIIIGVIVGVVLFAAIVSVVLKSSMISGITGSGSPGLPPPVPQEQAPLNDVQAQRVAQIDW